MIFQRNFHGRSDTEKKSALFALPNDSNLRFQRNKGIKHSVPNASFLPSLSPSRYDNYPNINGGGGGIKLKRFSVEKL